ncbi:MAG: 50S ribosomal protein L29 [Bacteroidota bacterium]
MEIENIRKLPLMELENHIKTEELVLRKLRSSHALNPLDNPMRIRKSRKLVARMKTVLQQMLQAKTANMSSLQERKLEQVKENEKLTTQ